MPTGKQLTSKTASLYFVSQSKRLVQRTGIDIELQAALWLIPDIRGWSLLRSVTSTKSSKPLRQRALVCPTALPHKLPAKCVGPIDRGVSDRSYARSIEARVLVEGQMQSVVSRGLPGIRQEGNNPGQNPKEVARGKPVAQFWKEVDETKDKKSRARSRPPSRCCLSAARLARTNQPASSKPVRTCRSAAW